MKNLSRVFNLHRQALIAGCSNLRRDPWGAVLSALSVGLLMAFPTAGILLLSGFNQSGLALDPEIILFLKNGQKAESLQASLKQRAEVKSVVFVSKEEAASQLRQDARMNDALNVLSANPLPDALVLTIKTDNPTALESLRSELSALPSVSIAHASTAWAETLFTWANLVRKVLWLFGLVLALGLVVVSFTLTRLQIARQKEEIDISRLLGATEGYIRRPLLYLGIVLGLFAGVFAVIGSYLVLGNAEPAFRQVVDFYGLTWTSPVKELGRTTWWVLLCGIVLGWLGALVALFRQR